MEIPFFVAGVCLVVFSVVPLVFVGFVQSPRSERLRRHPRLVAAVGIFFWALYLASRFLDTPGFALSSAGVAVILFLAAVILSGTGPTEASR